MATKKFLNKLIILIIASILLFSNLLFKTDTTSIAANKIDFLTSNEELNSFSLVLKNQDGESVPNAKFYIKELILDTDGVNYIEKDPVDVYGNGVGTEETLNEQIVKTFITDENGEVNVNLRGGKYKVVQLTTSEGHLLNETNEYEIDVEEIHGKAVAAKIEDPVYSTYQNCYSTSTKYAAEGRSDGYSLYYYEDYWNGGKMSLLDNNNVLVDTINTDQVHQIVSRDDGWYCLIEEWRTGIYYIGKIVDTDNKLGQQERIAEIGKYSNVSFTIDEITGNIIVAVSEENSNYIDIMIYSSKGIQAGVLRITGDGNNHVNSIVSNENGFYLSAYIYSKTLSTISESITIDNPYCILKVSKDLSSLENVRVLSTYSSSDDDQYRRIHKVIDLKDGNLYYIGSFEGTITFPASTTKSGKEITLTSRGGEEGIAIKLNSELLIEWATPIGGEGTDHFYDAGITDDGGIVIGGDSDKGNIIFDRDDTQAKQKIQTSSISNKAQNWRGVTVKLNSDGKALWAYEFGYAANEGMYGLAVLDNNSFVLCGFDAENGGTQGKAAFLRLNEYVVAEANNTPTYLNIENKKEVVKEEEKPEIPETPETPGTTQPPTEKPSDGKEPPVEQPSNGNQQPTEQPTNGNQQSQETQVQQPTNQENNNSTNSDNSVNTGDNNILITFLVIGTVIALNILQINMSKSKKKVSRIEKGKRNK